MPTRTDGSVVEAMPVLRAVHSLPLAYVTWCTRESLPLIRPIVSGTPKGSPLRNKLQFAFSMHCPSGQSLV